jgi:hypothetical protein
MKLTPSDLKCCFYLSNVSGFFDLAWAWGMVEHPALCSLIYPTFGEHIGFILYQTSAC